MDFSNAKASASTMHGGSGSTRKLDFLVSVTNMTVPGLMAIESGFANLTAAGMRTSNILNRELSLVGAGMMALGGIGVLALGLMTNEAIKFESQMKTVESLIMKTGNTASQMSTQMANLSATSKTLAMQFGKSPLEIAEGFTVLARAGVTANDQIQSVMTSAMQLSKIEGISVSESSKEIIQLTNLFGGTYTQDAPEFTRILAHAANISTTSAPDIMMGMQYAGGVAKLMWGNNTSQEKYQNATEIAAGVAALNQQGVSGAVAGNAIKSFANYMVKQMPKSTKALREIGLTQEDLKDPATGNFKRLPDVLHMFQKQFQDRGMSEGEIYQWFVRWGEPRQAQQYAKLIATKPGETSIYDQMLTQMNEEPYSLEEKTDKMMESASASFDKLSAAIQVLSINAGETLVPALKLVADVFTAIAGAVSSSPILSGGFTLGLLGATGAGAVALGKWAMGVKGGLGGVKGDLDPIAGGTAVANSNEKIMKSEENLRKEREKGERQQQKGVRTTENATKGIEKQRGVITEARWSGDKFAGTATPTTGLYSGARMNDYVTSKYQIPSQRGLSPVVLRDGTILMPNAIGPAQAGSRVGVRTPLRTERIMSGLTGTAIGGKMVDTKTLMHDLAPRGAYLGSPGMPMTTHPMMGWFGSTDEWMAHYYGTGYGPSMYSMTSGLSTAEQKEIRDKTNEANKKKMDNFRKSLRQADIEKAGGKIRGTGGTGRTSAIVSSMFGGYTGPRDVSEFRALTEAEQIKRMEDGIRKDMRIKTMEYRQSLSTYQARIKAIPGRAAGLIGRGAGAVRGAATSGLTALGGLVGLGPVGAGILIAGAVGLYAGATYAKSQGMIKGTEERIEEGLKKESNTIKQLQKTHDDLGTSIEKLREKQSNYNASSKEYLEIGSEIKELQEKQTSVQGALTLAQETHNRHQEKANELTRLQEDKTAESQAESSYNIYRAQISGKYGADSLEEYDSTQQALDKKAGAIGYEDYMAGKEDKFFKEISTPGTKYYNWAHTKAGAQNVQWWHQANQKRVASRYTSLGYVYKNGKWVKGSDTNSWLGEGGWWDRTAGWMGYNVNDPLWQWYYSPENQSQWGKSKYMDIVAENQANANAKKPVDPIGNATSAQVNAATKTTKKSKTVKVDTVYIKAEMSEERATRVVKKAFYDLAEGT